ncbi:MAG: nucleotide exchange factor GrpE [Pseudomonadota bacterium]
MAERDEPQFLDDLEDIEADLEAALDDEAELTPEQMIEELRAERDAFQDKFMRALADAENARKRAQKDRMEAENYGGSKLSRDMLPVFDNMKRAVEAVTDEQREVAAPLIEGIELTMRELLNVFNKHGIQVIDPQVGDRFDPKIHEAMFEAPLQGTKAGDIIQVSAQGFMLHDRILRPAQVGVSSNPG